MTRDPTDRDALLLETRLDSAQQRLADIIATTPTINLGQTGQRQLEASVSPSAPVHDRSARSSCALYCPFDASHLVSQSRFIAHCQRCERQGYGKQYLQNVRSKASASSLYFQENAATVVTILRRGNALRTADGALRVELLLEETNFTMISDASGHKPLVVPADVPQEFLLEYSLLVRCWLMNRLMHAQHAVGLQLSPGIVYELVRQLWPLICEYRHDVQVLHTAMYPIARQGTPMVIADLECFTSRVKNSIHEHQLMAEKPLDSSSVNLSLTGVSIIQQEHAHIRCVDYRSPIAPFAMPGQDLYTEQRLLEDYERGSQISEGVRNLQWQGDGYATVTDLLSLGQDDAQHKGQHDGDKHRTPLELLLDQRDYKRRRRSYRAKNVHITKRSQTQVHRELITAYMEELQQGK